MNLVFKDEHVTKIERYILFIKERVRYVQTTLQLLKLPAQLTIELVYTTVLWINLFPNNTEVSQTITPGSILTGREI